MKNYFALLLFLPFIFVPICEGKGKSRKPNSKNKIEVSFYSIGETKVQRQIDSSTAEEAISCLRETKANHTWIKSIRLKKSKSNVGKAYLDGDTLIINFSAKSERYTSNTTYWLVYEKGKAWANVKGEGAATGGGGGIDNLVDSLK